MGSSLYYFVEKRRTDGIWEPVAPVRESFIAQYQNEVLTWNTKGSSKSFHYSLVGLTDSEFPFPLAEPYSEGQLAEFVKEKYPEPIEWRYWEDRIQQMYPSMRFYLSDQHYRYLLLQQLQEYEHWDEYIGFDDFPKELALLGAADEIRLVFTLGC